jgi:Chaperone of endosialidase
LQCTNIAEIWGIAAATVVAGVGSAVISSNASKNAANAQANEQQNAINAQQSMFNTTQADYAPQVQLGQGAANMLGGIYGIGGVTGGTGGTTTGSPQPNYAAFYNSPGYQFSLSQGQNAINKQAAASGGLYSSNTLGALSGYTAGAASTQYNSYINQLTTMAGLGNAASSGVGTAATATGAGVANSYGNIGNAQANGILGQSNAFTNALGTATNGIGNSNLLSALNNGSYGSGTAAMGSEVSGGVDPAFNQGNSGSYVNSDCGLKKNIEPYCFFGTIPIYSFHYLDEPDTERKHIGVMAQEIQGLYPEVVKRGPHGYLMVNYKKLGVPTDEEWQALEGSLDG